MVRQQPRLRPRAIRVIAGHHFGVEGRQEVRIAQRVRRFGSDDDVVFALRTDCNRYWSVVAGCGGKVAIECGAAERWSRGFDRSIR
jgi:hypothetical protein